MENNTQPISSASTLQPEVAENTPPINVPKPQRRTKPAIIALAIFLLIILAVVFTSAFWLSKSTPKSEPKIKTIQPTAIPTPDPTSNWQTYTSKEFGYVISYPQGWTIEDLDPQTVILRSSGSAEFAKMIENDPVGVSPLILIEINDIKFSEPTNKYYKVTTFKTKSGISGYYYLEPGAPVARIIYEAPYEGGIKTMQISLLMVDQEEIDNTNKLHNSNIAVELIDEPIFRQIISTLKIVPLVGGSESSTAP